MKILFNGAECVNCGREIAVGTEAEVHPTKRGPRGGKKLVHAQCAGGSRSRRNPSRKKAGLLNLKTTILTEDGNIYSETDFPSRHGAEYYDPFPVLTIRVQQFRDYPRGSEQAIWLSKNRKLRDDIVSWLGTPKLQGEETLDSIKLVWDGVSVRELMKKFGNRAVFQLGRPAIQKVREAAEEQYDDMALVDS
jgi:hypothetical protein